MLIEFVVQCPECGATATSGNTLFTDYVAGKPLRIDLEMHATQMDFRCTSDDCGKRCGTGDFEVITDD